MQVCAGALAPPYSGPLASERPAPPGATATEQRRSRCPPTRSPSPHSPSTRDFHATDTPPRGVARGALHCRASEDADQSLLAPTGLGRLPPGRVHRHLARSSRGDHPGVRGSLREVAPGAAWASSSLNLKHHSSTVSIIRGVISLLASNPSMPAPEVP